MLVLAERLGRRLPLNTQMDFQAVSSGGRRRQPRVLVALVRSSRLRVGGPFCEGLHACFNIDKGENVI